MTKYDALIALRRAYKEFRRTSHVSDRAMEMRLERFPKFSFTNQLVAPGWKYLVKHDRVEAVDQVDEEEAA